MATETPHPRTRGRHPFLWSLLALVVLLVVVDQSYRAVARLRIKFEMDALRKEGYPVGPTELQASLRQIPDEQNAAIRIMEAADYVVVAAEAFSGNNWPNRAEELGPRERDLLNEMVTNNAPALEVVHQAAQLKDCRFPIDYTLGPSIRLPHLIKIKQLCNVLRAEAALDSEQGQPRAAVKSIVDSVALARALDTEPILVSQLVRIAALSIAASSLERVLTEHPLPEPELSLLLKSFRGAREASQQAFAASYLGEVCLGLYCFQANPAEVLELIQQPNSESGPWMRIALPLYRWTGLMDRDWLFYVQTMHHALQVAKMPFPDRLLRAKQLAQDEERYLQKHRLLIFSRMLLPALQRATEKSAENEARLRCVEAGLAFERSRAQNSGTMPDGLKTLAGVPSDPIDGAPLRFRKLTTGYVIYSVGTDGIDDGGFEKERPSARKTPPSKTSEESIWPVPAQRKGADVTFTVER